MKFSFIESFINELAILNQDLTPRPDESPTIYGYRMAIVQRQLGGHIDELRIKINDIRQKSMGDYDGETETG
tara:strand:+ start:10894 stop:11109 length:216 start_codon:yes stop_codon:yes gene_type:complete